MKAAFALDLLAALVLALVIVVTALYASSAEAHSLKRNCLWGGQNIFRVHTLCRDANSQPRATPSRSVRPTPPDKPDYGCKGDDKGKGHGKDKD